MSVMNLDKKKVNYKFISIGFKQNLGSECSKFYFKDQNKKKNFKNFIYNFFFFCFGPSQGIHLNPLGWLQSRQCRREFYPKVKFLSCIKNKKERLGVINLNSSLSLSLSLSLYIYIYIYLIYTPFVPLFLSCLKSQTF